MLLRTEPQPKSDYRGKTSEQPSAVDSGIRLFDPALADPTGNITCLGDRYALGLPVVDGFNPNEVSMQKLCAKPQYNGGLPGEHLGGWCLQTTPAPMLTGQVVFDTSAGARVNAVLQNPRTMLGCYYRCFCNWNVQNTAIQPVVYAHGGGARLGVNGAPLRVRSRDTYEVKVDVIDDFNVPPISHQGIHGAELVETAQFFNLIQTVGHHPSSVTISEDAHNDIICRGDLPLWEFPGPYDLHNFDDIQNLCASRLSGGNP